MLLLAMHWQLEKVKPVQGLCGLAPISETNGKPQNPLNRALSHGLSRRQFTKEFKLAAVARGLEVNPQRVATLAV
jgi:hypothetical protein